MKHILLTVCLLMVGEIYGQKAEYFTPYRQTDLRLPAVPLVVNDPYFSVWSPYDYLNEGPTKHWTGTDKPLLGLLRVDGVTYRFMGNDNRELLETIVPMADEEVWTAPYTTQKPATNDWLQPDFDDSGWTKAKGALGDTPEGDAHTLWTGENTDVYIRRTFDMKAKDFRNAFVIKYSHDDVCEIFLNGWKIMDTGNTWKRNEKLYLTTEQQALLRDGKNVIAVHCHNTTGGAYVDFGLYKQSIHNAKSMMDAKQKSVNVMATNTYYSFQCGAVDLNLVFTAPMLMNDYDMLTMPVNSISYQVNSNDGLPHKVQIGFFTTPEMAMNNCNKGLVPVVSEIVSKGTGYSCARTGTVAQPVLKTKGDHVCIDWGYFYLADMNGYVGIAPYNEALNHFIANGRSLTTQDRIEARKVSELTGLSYVKNIGVVEQKPVSSFMLLGYDEVKDIEYLNKQYKAYWAHDGKVDIYDAFSTYNDKYDSIMQVCRKFDKQIYDDGFQAGGREYAEILSGAYRHVMAAHKLFKDDKGNLLFFSKENDSNGSVNTVDLTYPSAPLFLTYNPELLKGMMTSIFDYSQSGRWSKPFAAHDMGTYPLANGQTYPHDMPLEESGNMLTLAATISMLDGNTKYIDKYWDIITLWNKYLVEYGQDPDNQFCTDDFAGHWAHNCNLSIKAIMGILGYSRMAAMKGLKKESKESFKMAKKMAEKWEKDAREDDHYRLAFDRDSTWSQKYNMVWDYLWQTHIFPVSVMQKETAFYVKHQNKYGLPLDCRKDYTKSDWIMWCAAMADTQEEFDALVQPVYKYINETSSRVAISDWHDTRTGDYQHFIGRSVIGGYWMKVLMKKMTEKKNP